MPKCRSLPAVRASWVGLLLVFAACPQAPTPDAGDVDGGLADAGLDAGASDAGRPARDAGTPDAGLFHAPLDAWCRLRAEAECQRDLRCGRLAADAGAECLARRTTIEACDQVAFSRGVEAQRLQYLEREAVACVNGFATGSCVEAPAACASAFTGLVPPDGGCVSPLDCDGAGFCYLYDGTCPHFCRGYLPLGAACDGFTRRCDPGAAACAPSDAGGNTCQPRKAPDAGCAVWSECGDGLACLAGWCTPLSAGPGESCGLRNGYPTCPEEYFCRQGPTSGGTPSPGTCERKAGLGGTCTGPGSCLPSLRCSTLLTTGTCLVRAARGEGCAAWDDCQDGLWCADATQRCEPLPGPGGDCSFEASGYRCATGSTCHFGATRCVAQQAVGAPCSYDGECLSNDCEFGAQPDGGFGGRCVPSCSQRADGGP